MKTEKPPVVRPECEEVIKQKAGSKYAAMPPEERFEQNLDFDLNAEAKELLKELCEKHQATVKDGPDTLFISDGTIQRVSIEDKDGNVVQEGVEAILTTLLYTCFLSSPDGDYIAAPVANMVAVFKGDGLGDLPQRVKARNLKHGQREPFPFPPDPAPGEHIKSITTTFYDWPQKTFPQIEKDSKELVSSSNDYPVFTAQEWQCVTQGVSDAKTLSHFKMNEQKGSIYHQRPGAGFRNEFTLSQAERDAGLGLDYLCAAISQLDVDAAWIAFYISRQLIPPAPIPDYATAKVTIDIADVAHKTLGGKFNNPIEEREKKAQVWHVIKWLSRNVVIGQRTIPYFDKDTDEVIQTRLESAPWKILSQQVAEEPCLWSELDIPPVVTLAASPEWTEITTNPNTAQFLPYGEVIGAIRGNQPGGAWARALGLSYVDWCRMNLRAAIRGEAPTRRGLLDTHQPKKRPYKELIGDTHAVRIQEYWAKAESHLVDAGLILVTPSKKVSTRGSGAWIDPWLDTKAAWRPSPSLLQVLKELAAHKYEGKPRQLNPAKRGGRPRKSASKKLS